MTDLTYSFKDVNAAIVGPGGAVSLTGNASDEGIVITPRADKNTLLIGADGSGMHSLHADKSATVTINLLKNSNVNALLSVMYNLQQTASTLWGQNVITIVTSVGDAITLTGVAFRKLPTVTYATDGGTMSWEFDAIEMNQVLASTL